MILRSLMQIGKQTSSQTLVHCNSQLIVAKVFVRRDDEMEFLIVEKNKREYGPEIRGTSGLKPGLGFYKWEHLLGCVCDNTKNAKEGVSDDAKNLSNLQTLTDFTSHVSDTSQIPEIERVVRILELLSREDIREKLKEQAIKENLPNGQYATIEFADLPSPWYQRPEVLKFWAKTGFDLSSQWSDQQKKAKKPQPKTEGAESENKGICLVTGVSSSLQRTSIALDGWKEKPRIAAFNCAAYRSRGQSQTFNAPLSVEAADAITKGWQYLVRKEGENYHKLEDQIYVFWGDPIIKPFGQQARDPKVWKELLIAAQSGKLQRVAPERFHVLGIGKHTSNAVVISWLDRSAEQTAQGIIRWGRWLTTESEQSQYYTLDDLIVSLRPRKRKRRADGKRFDKHEVRLWRDLLHIAYGEGTIPSFVLNRLVERLSTELEPYPLDRLTLLNICLCSINELEEINVSELTPLQQNAFNAGRLFNLICYAQNEAIGETGKTLLASNARLAVTRPQRILPELVTRYQEVYRPKLLRDNAKLARFIDTEITKLINETILSPVNNSEQMGWFWKGYYYRAEKPAETSKGGN